MKPYCIFLYFCLFSALLEIIPFQPPFCHLPYSLLRSHFLRCHAKLPQRNGCSHPNNMASYNVYCGYFPLSRTNWSQISGNFQARWNNIFRLYRANQWEWLLPLFLSLPNSLIRAKNMFVKYGKANFGGNIPTKMSGPPPEVISNIPVGRNWNGLFHLNSNRNFRNLWHNGKHPVLKFVVC